MTDVIYHGGGIDVRPKIHDQVAERVEQVQAARSGIGGCPRLQQVARKRSNTFEAMMDAARYCSLGQMSHALYDVGGEYRRNM